MSQQVTPGNPRENTHSRDCAAAGAAVELENGAIDPDLRVIIERWADLPDAMKAGIIAMVRATGERDNGSNWRALWGCLRP
ncbi:MAG: hypothetical protein H8E66_09690 [Planctomycetes bacterium]|nr:hypothetical protein [Planctomycetota bacterium]